MTDTQFAVLSTKGASWLLWASQNYGSRWIVWRVGPLNYWVEVAQPGECS